MDDELSLELEELSLELDDELSLEVDELSLEVEDYTTTTTSSPMMITSAPPLSSPSVLESVDDESELPLVAAAPIITALPSAVI